MYAFSGFVPLRSYGWHLFLFRASGFLAG